MRHMKRSTAMPGSFMMSFVKYLCETACDRKRDAELLPHGRHEGRVRRMEEVGEGRGGAALLDHVQYNLS
jgi:hypothetical protein